MAGMMLKLIATVLIFAGALNAKTFAQEKTTENASGSVYANFDLSGLKTTVYGAEMRSWSFGFHAGKNFGRNRIFRSLSGFEAGYRREKSDIKERGHYFNFKLFRTFPGISGIKPKISGGFEWGFPSANLDKTIFHHNDGDLLEYEYIFPERKSGLPKIGPRNDATLNPLVELALTKQVGILSLEGGLKNTFMKFRRETYRLHSDNIEFASEQSLQIIPSIFLRLGVRF